MRPLVEQRQSEGLRGRPGGHRRHPGRVRFRREERRRRAWLSQAGAAGWKVPPRYLLLLGSATYDPRDYLGLGGDLVSERGRADRRPRGSVRQLVRGHPRSRVGLRWPAASAQRGRDGGGGGEDPRTRRAADARSPVLLASDSLGTSDFPEMTADLGPSLPDAAATLIVRGRSLTTCLHQRFLDAARSGPALVNYTGHASELFWSGNLHTIDDTAVLAGGGTSLWIHMTCLTGVLPGSAPSEPRSGARCSHRAAARGARGAARR